jgi:hypothetical protein
MSFDSASESSASMSPSSVTAAPALGCPAAARACCDNTGGIVRPPHTPLLYFSPPLLPSAPRPLCQAA